MEHNHFFFNISQKPCHENYRLVLVQNTERNQFEVIFKLK